MKANRAEKKSRKAIQKLGMKPVTGITRITIKKSKNVRFTARGVVLSAGAPTHPLTRTDPVRVLFS